MTIAATRCAFEEIEAIRDIYRLEMGCQIIHDSIHTRPGWTQEFLLSCGKAPVGYGSLAVGGPWQQEPALYEFFVVRSYRLRIFELFHALQQASAARRVETQSNDTLLTNMLLTFASKVSSESILFYDSITTSVVQPGVTFRQTEPRDAPLIAEAELDPEARWVLERRDSIIAAGDVLYHYNRPYGDVYMKVVKADRRQGFGSFLVQELKRVCYEGGSIPAARCNVQNVASRCTLQKAGFVPCAHILVGNI